MLGVAAELLVGNPDGLSRPAPDLPDDQESLRIPRNLLGSAVHGLSAFPAGALALLPGKKKKTDLYHPKELRSEES
jgi:hypothetical protein